MSMSGSSVLVVGLAATGAAVARALIAAGAQVTAIDAAADDAVRRRAADVEALGVRTMLGVQSTDAAGDYDVVVPSPGVPEHHPWLAGRDDRTIWSEPELAWRLNDGRTRLIAVTGTNGKTTTTEMLAACLEAPAAGNIGTPLVELLSGDSPPELVVAELSSFQLRFAHTVRPEVAVLLNVSPDHLDWHGSLESYGAAKSRLWAQQGSGDTLVASLDDDGARRMVAARPPPGRMIGFTLGAPAAGQVGVVGDQLTSRIDGDPVALTQVDALAAKGPHNVANALAAAAAALRAGAAPDDIAERLQAYRPGAHRLEVVATLDGVTYVDDSKATNPHAAAAALDAYAPDEGTGTAPRVLWIAGGLGKGLRFDSLEPHIRRSVKAAFTIGAAGAELADLVRACGRPATDCQTLVAAVAAARAVARPGDAVLLAPACASMDQFRNYAERGDVFRSSIPEVAHGAA